LHNDEKKFLKILIYAFYSCIKIITIQGEQELFSRQFQHNGPFDLFRLNEAMNKALTSTHIDVGLTLRGRQRHTIIDTWHGS